MQKMVSVIKILTLCLVVTFGIGMSGIGVNTAASENTADSSEAIMTQNTDEEEKDFGPMETVTHTAYISGYPDNTVRPDASLTRGELAKMLYTLSGNDGSYTPTFNDVQDCSNWYYNPIGYLEELKIIGGYPDGTFRPNKYCSRNELVTIISKYYGDLIASDREYPDVPGDHWARIYIASATGHGWVSGFPDGTFGGDQNCTRAQTIKILNRILGRGKYGQPDLKNNFTDISPTHWAYGEILSATNSYARTQSIYNTVLAKYWQAYSDDFLSYDIEFVSPSLITFNPDKKQELYFAIRDIDGNKTPELVIGADTDEISKVIYDLYTYSNGKFIRLYNDNILGERTNCIICANGVLAIGENAAPWKYSRNYYRISSDGYTLKLIESTSVEYSDENNSIERTKYYHSSEWVNEITQAAYNRIEQKYPDSYGRYAGSENMDWIKLSDYFSYG